MITAGYAQYRTITTQTASPGQLLLQLDQGAIKQVGQARTSIDENNPASAHGHIVRAQEIILELQRTLDHDRGGDLAGRLDALYTFFRQQLVTANIQKDSAPLD